MIALDKCRGCNDDFYNGRVNIGGGTRCWSAENGSMVTRYAIGTWTRPTEPGAFSKVTVPSCYRKKGVSYCDTLPDFVKASDVRVRKAAL